MTEEIGVVNERLRPEEQKHVSKKERLIYYISALFRDMSYAMLGYLSYFYIDVLGLKSISIVPYTLMIIIVRLWDGIDDPLMGVYFDKSATKDGKARPFFKKTGLILSILIILIFSAPTFSTNQVVNVWLRFAFALVLYIAFSTLHTLNGTAYMTYYNSISPNPNERAEIVSHSRIFSNIGTGIIGGLIPILLGFFENDNVKAKTYIYLGTACFVGICFYIYNRLMYRGVKERVFSTNGKTQKISDMFKGFAKNKVLLILMISNAIGGIITTGATSLYFYTYNMGNPALATYVGFAGIPTFFLGAMLAPILIKKFEKRNIIIGCALSQICISVIYILCGYQNIIIVFLIAFLTSLPSTIRGVVYWNMIADSVDYVEWKTGERNDGMIYSIEGFMGKCVGSLGGIMAGLFLSYIKFRENEPSQSDFTMNGLFYIPLVVGIISTIASTIPFFFHKFNKKEHQKALSEIQKRKEALQADLDGISQLEDGIASQSNTY